MNKSAKTLIATFLLMTVILLAGCSSGEVGKPQVLQSVASPSGVPVKERVQSSTAANVTIEVELVRIEGSTLVFEVAMDTHSVDLDKFNLGELAILRDGTGKEYRPASWNAEAGGHHRSGTLTFRLPDSSSLANSKYMEMVIRDVAVKERVLKWQL
ncbi:MAG: hypothetical protein HYX79_09460 [Chloroflexi bacterium]|nr:hypothetical protein [Chloroflexota bacterium]